MTLTKKLAVGLTVFTMLGGTALASDVSADREAALQALSRGKQVTQAVTPRVANAANNAPCDKDCCTKHLRNAAPAKAPEFTDHG